MPDNTNCRIEAYMGPLNGPIPNNRSDFHVMLPTNSSDQAPDGSSMAGKCVSSVSDFQTRYPDLHKAFIKTIATEVCNRSRNSTERIKKNIKEGTGY